MTKVGDDVLALKTEKLREVPYPSTVFAGASVRVIDYGLGVEAGVVLGAGGTGAAFRQIGDERVEIPTPDIPTAVLIFLAIHTEIVTSPKAHKLPRIAEAEREARLLFQGFGPKLRTLSATPVSDASSSIDALLSGAPPRGQPLRVVD